MINTVRQFQTKIPYMSDYKVSFFFISHTATQKGNDCLRSETLRYFPVTQVHIIS